MISNFINTYKRLLQYTKYSHHRYIYSDFNTDNRLTGLIGPRGTGKTTLLTQLLPILVAQGLKVAVIKHAHHNFDIDHPGKDSFELREAGAGRAPARHHRSSGADRGRRVRRPAARPGGRDGTAAGPAGVAQVRRGRDLSAERLR